MDVNFYINDLAHRGFTFTESGTSRITLTCVEDSTLDGFAAGSSVEAYAKVRNYILKNRELPFSCTTTQRDAYTDIDIGTVIFNITIGRNEVYNGTKWQSVGRRSSVTGITASTTQAQGNGLLSADINIITTVANNNDTVTLPETETGTIVMVVNKGSNKIRIYPNTDDDLGEGTNEKVTLASGSSITFYCYSTTNWTSS